MERRLIRCACRGSAEMGTQAEPPMVEVTVIDVVNQAVEAIPECANASTQDVSAVAMHTDDEWETRDVDCQTDEMIIPRPAPVLVYVNQPAALLVRDLAPDCRRVGIDDTAEWLKGLNLWGKEASLRAAIAIGRIICGGERSGAARALAFAERRLAAVALAARSPSHAPAHWSALLSFAFNIMAKQGARAAEEGEMKRCSTCHKNTPSSSSS